MVRESDHIIELYTEEEIIETTVEHPFLTEDGWKDAADLQTGDKIKSKNKEDIEIKDIKFSYKPKKVYDFEVSNWHTYFVGTLTWLVHNAKKCLSGIVKKVSNRLKYMGRMPGKNSKTGREVFNRMKNETPPRARIFRKEKQFWDGQKWRNIKEADMGHKTDAVHWWNAEGRKYGAKSKEVRDWMRNSDNYELQYYRTNRSKGAQIKETYKEPLK